MQEIVRKKRKQAEQRPSPATKTDPFPEFPHPTPEECRSVRDDLLAHHGFPQEFVKYQRKQQQTHSAGTTTDNRNGGGPQESESVLDGLVSTILSQNTTDTNSRRAFLSLKSLFPSWEHVVGAETKLIENAIRCGGLAPKKAACIKNLLTCLHEKKGKLCLEYLRDLSVDEIKEELFQYKGIGPKTVACVLMFNLQQDDFPVDTHVGIDFTTLSKKLRQGLKILTVEHLIQVLQIAKAIGWIPTTADAKKTYLHLNRRIPNDLKFDLNCLLFTHGKVCKKCTRQSGKQQKSGSNIESCPLLNYC